MLYEERITIKATVAQIWKLYATVNQWSQWDPDTKASSIDGKFETGATGWHQSPTGPRTRLEFVSVVPQESFRVESRSPLSKIQFDHQLMPQGDEVEVIHRVAFSGLLAPLWGRVVGKVISQAMPLTLQALKVKAEKASKKELKKASKGRRKA